MGDNISKPLQSFFGDPDNSTSCKNDYCNRKEICFSKETLFCSFCNGYMCPLTIIKSENEFYIGDDKVEAIRVDGNLICHKCYFSKKKKN